MAIYVARGYWETGYCEGEVLTLSGVPSELSQGNFNLLHTVVLFNDSELSLLSGDVVAALGLPLPRNMRWIVYESK